MFGIRANNLGRSFNPCFRGTRPRTFWLTKDKRSSLRLVSILVFVELALGRYDPTIYTLKDAVSILVFVELALGPIIT